MISHFLVTAIASALTSRLDSSRLLPFEQLQPSLQQRFQLAWKPGFPTPTVVYPHTLTELSEVIKLAKANQWRVLPWGSGSKIHWGGIGKPVDCLISTQRMNRVIEYAIGDLTLTVEAGITLGEVNALLSPQKQFLAFDPAYPEQATLGGIIATGDSGSWRHRYGGVRDRLIGISFVRSDGEVAKAGGRVVKNVAGYDLMKLFTGSYGTLGIISQATFRLYPIPDHSATVVLSGEPEAIAQATQTILSSSLTPTIVDIRTNPNSGISLITRFQSIPASVNEQCQRILELALALNLTGNIAQAQEETQQWQTWQNQIYPSDSTTILCKIGIRPTEAITFLQTLKNLSGTEAQAVIHARIGLGLIRFNHIRSTQLIELRSHLNSKAGFLTLLEAPFPLKQSLETWGYSSNALKIMHSLKQQFDPDNLLSPHRFLGSI